MKEDIDVDWRTPYGNEFHYVRPCRTSIHAYRDWKLSSKFELLISAIPVSVAGESVLLPKTNTTKSKSTQ